MAELENLTPDEIQELYVGGCPDCLEAGSEWVHLRVCLECQHVGCCDNSPETHATKHWQATEHEVIQSLEPGEMWRWNYATESETPFGG